MRCAPAAQQASSRFEKVRARPQGRAKALFPAPEAGSRLRCPFSLRYEAKVWHIGPAIQRGPPCASARGSPSHPKRYRLASRMPPNAVRKKFVCNSACDARSMGRMQRRASLLKPGTRGPPLKAGPMCQTLASYRKEKGQRRREPASGVGNSASHGLGAEHALFQSEMKPAGPRGRSAYRA